MFQDKGKSPLTSNVLQAILWLQHMVHLMSSSTPRCCFPKNAIKPTEYTKVRHIPARSSCLIAENESSLHKLTTMQPKLADQKHGTSWK